MAKDKVMRCPRCGKAFRFFTVAAHKPFPFCSQRCRDVDLGNWMTEKYAVPDPNQKATEDD